MAMSSLLSRIQACFVPVDTCDACGEHVFDCTCTLSRHSTDCGCGACCSDAEDWTEPPVLGDGDLACHGCHERHHDCTCDRGEYEAFQAEAEHCYQCGHARYSTAHLELCGD